MIIAGWNNYAVSEVSEISLVQGVDSNNKVVKTRISIIVDALPKKNHLICVEWLTSKLVHRFF